MEYKYWLEQHNKSPNTEYFVMHIRYEFLFNRLSGLPSTVDGLASSDQELGDPTIVCRLLLNEK